MLPRSKRHHKKSHGGCMQCKKRKVKCDEIQPVCGRCATRAEDCSLADRRSAFSSPLNTWTPPSVTVQSESPRDAVKEGLVNSATPSSVIGVDDLEWIQTFLLETCPTLAFTETTLKTWQYDIPKIAFRSRFLLLALMAVAALHKASGIAHDSAERMRCCVAARRHHDVALTLFIPALSEAGPSSCVPLLCFNVLFSLMPFGWQALSFSHDIDANAMSNEGWSPRLETLLSSTSILDRFLEVTETWRGTDVIINQYFEWLQTSKVGFLLRYPDFDLLPEISADAQRSLQRLSHSLKLIDDTEMDLAQRSMYELQLQRLYKVCKCTADEGSRSFILSWPTVLPAEFVRFLQQRNHVAVAMVAFWAACFHSLRDRWWARGWSQALVDEAASFLGPEWVEVLEWPKQVVAAR